MSTKSYFGLKKNVQPPEAVFLARLEMSELVPSLTKNTTSENNRRR
jgi:hypothetical protein